MQVIEEKYPGSDNSVFTVRCQLEFSQSFSVPMAELNPFWHIIRQKHVRLQDAIIAYLLEYYSGSQAKELFNHIPGALGPAENYGIRFHPDPPEVAAEEETHWYEFHYIVRDAEDAHVCLRGTTQAPSKPVPTEELLEGLRQWIRGNNLCGTQKNTYIEIRRGRALTENEIEQLVVR